MADLLDQALPLTAAGTQRAAEAAKAQQAAAAQKQAQAAQETQQVEATPAAQLPNAAGPQLVQDAGTGQKLVEDTDGGVWMRSVGGHIEKLAPHAVGAALNPQSGYFPATLDEVKEHTDKQAWDEASLNAKSDFAARRILTTVADGVTAIPRLGAKLLGAGPEVDQKYSGENVVRQLDALLAGENTAAEESAGARKLAGGAPGALKVATDVGGFVLGGELGGVLGKGAEALGASKLGAVLGATSLSGGGKLAESAGTRIASALGLDAAKAAKLGAYADTVAQGAALGNTQAAQEAWIKDEPLTAEAQWNAIGLGALLGVGGHVALDALHGLPRAGLSAAEKVFGKSRAAGELTAATDVSAQELSEALTGVKQPEGFGSRIKDATEFIKNKVQEAQAARTGAKLSDVKEFGALSEGAERARDLYARRDEIFSQGTKDLKEALTQLHSEGSLLADNVVDVTMKREHMARLLESADSQPIMQLAKDKAAEFNDALANMKQVTARGRSILGGGKQIADIRAAYEDAIDGLASAERPADVASTLDVFKRATQRAKVNAEQTANKVASGIERNQAFKRAELMEQVSDNTRRLLEDDKVFGDFGTAQRETNSRFNRVLDTDKYIKGQLFENTGRISQGIDFGKERYELSPARLESYLNGLGTNKAARVDEYLRDNITARKDLAETLGKYYDTGDQAATVANASKAADKSLGVLKNLDETLRVTNAYDSMLAAEAHAKGHGSAGATLAAMAGHMFAGPVGAGAAVLYKAIDRVLSNPASLTRQALAFRDSAQKLTGMISKNVGKALSSEGASIAARAAKPLALKAGLETAEKYSRRYATTVARVAELNNDPSKMIDAVSSAAAHVEHPGVQQALVSTSMQALSFLASKLPAPLYQDAVSHGSQLNNVSDTARDKFMDYATAVNKPQDFFSALGRGEATYEQAETAAALMPQAFGLAQQELVTQFAAGKVTASYQVRLNLQRMLQVNIEPVAKQDLQAFLSQAGATANQQQAAKSAGSAGAPSVAKNISSNLNNLKV